MIDEKWRLCPDLNCCGQPSVITYLSLGKSDRAINLYGQLLCLPSDFFNALIAEPFCAIQVEILVRLLLIKGDRAIDIYG